jgi:hypothetical protein
LSADYDNTAKKLHHCSTLFWIGRGWSSNDTSQEPAGAVNTDETNILKA